MIARSFLLKTLVWYKYGIKKERSRVFNAKLAAN